MIAVKLCCPVNTENESHWVKTNRDISARNTEIKITSSQSVRPCSAPWKPLICCWVVIANTFCTWAENAAQQLISLIWIFTSCCANTLVYCVLGHFVPVYLDEIMTPMLMTRRLNATDCDKVSPLKCFVYWLALFLIFFFSWLKSTNTLKLQCIKYDT